MGNSIKELWRGLRQHVLRKYFGKFDMLVSPPQEVKEEISWWLNNLRNSSAPIARDNPKFYIATDACKTGWRAHRNETDTRGHFTLEETNTHINILELKSLCYDTFESHILIKIDNTSAVAGINKVGSTKSLGMDYVVHEIWDWAMARKKWITATHIPGILNVEADRESRETETRTE